MTLGSSSKAEWLASQPAPIRQEILDAMTREERAALAFDWNFWARPSQLPPPGDWTIWLIQTGRGWGKTLTGAQWVRRQVETGAARRVALVNDTAADVRDVMIEGPSGLVQCGPPGQRPVYTPSTRRLTWPNGAVAIAYAAEAPELLRGPEHDAAWCDELAKWQNLRARDPQGATAWDNLLFGLHGGISPRVVVTTTPRRVATLMQIRSDPRTVVTRGRLEENRANLSPEFLAEMTRRYGGTRLGRQELEGELLEDVPGAIFQRAWFERPGFRLGEGELVPARLRRIVVAVDPAVSAGETAHETGIVVAAIDRDRVGYVLADVSLRGTTETWARRAVAAYRDWGADRIVAEANQGGDLVGTALRLCDAAVPITLVHASRGKRTRAEPVALLYEQGRVHHVARLDALEEQLVTWTPEDDTPNDRLDALVWALTHLVIEAPGPASAGEAMPIAAGTRERSPWASPWPR
jgi:phage terminase large subunit-like protein